MINQPGVSKLSYSAIRSFMTSPVSFHKQYIMGERLPTSLPMTTGSAWHKGMESFHTEPANYIGDALKLYEDLKKETVNFTEEEWEKGKDTLEKMLKLYRDQERRWEIDKEYVEIKVEAPSPVKGGYPIVGRIDGLQKGKPNPIDHKYVSRYGGVNKEDYYIQAWFYYHLVKVVKNEYPDCFILSEMKKSMNRDKSPQLQDTIIIYEPRWMNRVSEWYREVSMLVKNQGYYPANPFKSYDNEDWKDYITN